MNASGIDPARFGELAMARAAAFAELKAARNASKEAHLRVESAEQANGAAFAAFNDYVTSAAKAAAGTESLGSPWSYFGDEE